MTNLSQMLQQAQEMQEKVARVQAELAEQRVKGSAGAGLVTVELNGKGVMTRLSIAPELFDREEAEVVEDLIVAAHNDAKTKSEKLMQEEMSKLTGGLQLPPGLKLPF
jgi:DNA-binding YbaB/EbfC family protein